MVDEDSAPPTDETDSIVRAFTQAPVAVVALYGPQHRAWIANDACLAVFPRWRIGVPIASFAPEIDFLIDLLDQVYATGERCELDAWPVRYSVGDGDYYEVFTDYAISAVRGDGGEILGVEVTATDVSEHVKARQAAQDEAAELAARYTSAHDGVNEMQEALLPTDTPVMPAVDVAAAYLVATEDTAAGGDWFDAIPASDGRLFLVLGDVVGHGVRAAAVMAQLRTAVRMQLTAGVPLSDAIEAVDRFSSHVRGAQSATMCIGELHSATGYFEYCTIGHPPPLLIRADGPPRYLEPTGSGPLSGAIDGVVTKTDHLDAGEAIVLYSDGIIERPGRSTSQSSVEFADVTARILHSEGHPIDDAYPAPVERLCARAVELLTRQTGFRDDITLLAAQRRTPAPPLAVTVPADEHAERTVREQLRSWLHDLPLARSGGSLLVEHAIGEYVTNTVEHAYDAATDPGDVTVTAGLHPGGRLHAEVTDTGRWRDSETIDSDRGRGLAMAQTMIPDTVIDHDGNGTTIRLSYRLTRPAHILTDPQTEYQQSPTVSEPRIDFTDEHTLVVTGDIDTAAAAELSGALTKHSRAGTIALRIDLTAATHIGSAAVSALIRHMRNSRRHNNIPTLIAPPGTTAHHVLTLVGLPTHHDDSPDTDLPR
ncbi:SpoIIE family protein phosphatase [Gordonia sp. TBRC 11910]|uniref:SpoIIE family protein phosphatase n=1 Tax=Gordonia asplenii TaxID=2725283 RepID=A0A848KUX0_9ACTN|nr:SpoIIE family protein phosphatase [Gordonia asplenii]NMO01827.1 SpoIIE family protein phosphatase [Gordonia asplenii]